MAAVIVVNLTFLTLFNVLFLENSAQGFNISTSSEEDNEKIINNFLITYLQKQNEMIYNKDIGETYNNPPRFKDPEVLPTDEPFFSDESWSVIWYIASFSGLIAFFLVVSCSEWCCRKHVRIVSHQNSSGQSQITPQSTITSTNQETPPPAYDLFAPPSYDSLSKPREKGEYDVYVVPVHAIDSMLRATTLEPDDEPPSYSAVNLSFVRELGEPRESGSNDNSDTLIGSPRL